MQDCAAGLQQAAEGAEAASNLSPPQPEHNPDASLWTADLDTSDSDVEESVSFDDLVQGSELPPPTSGTESAPPTTGVPPPSTPFQTITSGTDLPTEPADQWRPESSVPEWTERTWQSLPAPLRRWILTHEPSLQAPWETIVQEHRKALPVLSKFCLVFSPPDRKEAVKWMFNRKGVFHNDQERAEFDDLLCGFPEEFGHIQFLLSDDIDAVKCILGLADCFLSIIDDCGFPAQIIWDPLPRVEDPPDFQAGGVHSEKARQHWDSIPGLSKWVRHWIHNKVWFTKLGKHEVNRSARNASCLNPSHKSFDPDKHAFLDGKIADLLKVQAIVELPAGVLPDVLTRLSLAPKPGVGELWRVIMDMRPENLQYRNMRVRMEHLGHFSSIFQPGMLMFSCDLKSAYFSISVDDRVSRTMGFSWNGKMYRFVCLPFGWKMSSYTFVKCGRQVLRKWRQFGPGSWASRCRQWQHPNIRQQTRCMTYIDDNAAGHRLFPVCVWLRNAMLQELTDLGFSLSAKGELLPLPVLELLGMIAHLAKPVPTWHLPARKEEALRVVAQELLHNNSEEGDVLCRKAGKYVGKLTAASRAVPVGRLLFREVNQCIYQGGSPNWAGRTRLSPQSVQDIQWIAGCFHRWNAQGSPIWVQSTIVPVDYSVIGDAGPRAVGFQVLRHEGVLAADSISMLPARLARRCSDMCLDVPLPGVGTDLVQVPADYQVTSSESRTIVTADGTIELTDSEADLEHVHKELLMVALVLRSQADRLYNRRVCIFVDAVASVAYICNWGGPSIFLTRLVKLIWSICARFGIRIVQVSHIAGTEMITVGVDALSRPYKFSKGGEMDRDDWRLRRSQFEWLQQQLGTRFTIDRMASRANRRCEAFCSVSDVDPDSEARSAFLVDWNVQRSGQTPVNYCFPPFALIGRVIQHVREGKARATIIVPDWPSQAWWPELMELSEVVLAFEHGPVFERVRDKEWQPVTKQSFRALAVTVSAQFI